MPAPSASGPGSLGFRVLRQWLIPLSSGIQGTAGLLRFLCYYEFDTDPAKAIRLMRSRHSEVYGNFTSSLQLM